MKRVYGAVGVLAAVVAMFAVTAPSASAADVTTKKECFNRTLLLSGSCTVTYTCPTAANFCLARGDVRVVANKVTGINVKGDVTVATPPGPVPERVSYAECGGKGSNARQCSATASLILVDPGDPVAVQCNSNRNFISLGVVFTDLYCQGTFTARMPDAA